MNDSDLVSVVLTLLLVGLFVNKCGYDIFATDNTLEIRNDLISA